MYRHIVPALAAFTLTLLMPQLVKAEDSTATAMATVVIYRAHESSKTDHLKFNLHAGNEFVGRMQSGKSLVFRAPAGSYTLDTTLPGAEPLTLDIKPGAVHYVHSRLELQGNRVDLALVEVAEQVARNHGAEDRAGTI